MCRHLAYLGPSVSLADLLYGAPHALVEQARAPKLQLWGDDNPDGFGAGWYPTGDDMTPLAYRTTTPIWSDDAFRSRAGAIEAAVVIAAARLRSPGSPVEEEAVAPLVDGKWLCSLNGIVEGFHDGVGDRLREQLPDAQRAAIRSSADTEVCFKLFLERTHRGDDPAVALASLIEELESVTTGLFNFLLTDGRRVVASAVGNSLFVRTDPLVVASEPLDDDPAWSRVDDRTVLVADRVGVRTFALGA